MTQRWSDVVFVNWPYEPSAVQRLLPPGVEIDVYDGSAWVSLVPFRMERLALLGAPPLPGLNSFPEINVRTYVTAGRRRGVWFFSLDIDKRLPTAVARGGYHLPYCFGRAEHRRTADGLHSVVDRRWPRAHPTGARADLLTRLVGPLGDNDLSPGLVEFLTSRWGLIAATRRGRLRYAPVDHPAWDIRTAEVLSLDQNLVQAAGLPEPVGPPTVMWSPGVDVRVGLPHRLKIDQPRSSQ